MSGNFYLPEKADRENQYSLPTAGTYTWVVPNANNDASPVELTMNVWSAGGGGSGGGGPSRAGAGGGSGAFVQATYTFNVGDEIIIVVPSGGSAGTAAPDGSPSYQAGDGGNGGNASIKIGATNILTVNGGTGGIYGWYSTSTGGIGSSTWTNHASCTLVKTVAGANGGDGYNLSGTDGDDGSSVINSGAGGQGGTGGVGGTTTAGGDGQGVSGAGGAGSANANGGKGGNATSVGAGEIATGGGGAAGYYAGSAAPDRVGSSGNGTWYGGAGGAGGAGYVSFKFTTTSGGSAGSPPVAE